MNIKKIHEWSDNKDYIRIIETIEQLPKTDLNFSLKNELARAYNNNSEYDKAIQIQLSQSSEGNKDAYWNYIIAYAYFHKSNYNLALEYFENSKKLGKSDLNDYLVYCKRYININKHELKNIADKYRDFGFNVSCITKKPNLYNTNSRSYFKTPSHSWLNLFNSEQTRIEYENYDWLNSVGIGTFTYWNNLVVIDIDGCNDMLFLGKLLMKLGLPQNYEWVVESGSKNGYHIYYYGSKIDECENDDVVSAFPPKLKFEKYLDKIEFLWETHTVLPPSVHGSGNKYSFLNDSFPTNPPVEIDTDTIYDFIKTFLDFQEIKVGGVYGEIFTEISSKTEFITDFKEEDITKYLLNDVYLFVDVETSGLPQKTNFKTKYPEIIQIAWVLTNKLGVVLKKNSFIIDTSFFIENDHSEFVNIDFESARKVNFPINHAIRKLTEDIKMSDYVVAHNIEFGLEILGHYYTSYFGANPFIGKNKICTMKSTVNFCAIPNNYGFKYPKLSELYFKLYGYQITNSNNAEVDVMHTLKCFKKLQYLGVL